MDSASKMTKMLNRAILLAFVFLGSALLCAAQGSVSLSGIVKSGGQPIPGATVTATLGKQKAVTVTDDDGRYQFEDLTPGSWAVTVQLFGFTPTSLEIQLTATATADWDLALRPRPQTAVPQQAQGGRGGFQAMQNTTESQVTAELARSAAPQTEITQQDSTTESFLVNGSISQGLNAGAMGIQDDMQRGQFPGMRADDGNGVPGLPGAAGPGGPSANGPGGGGPGGGGFGGRGGGGGGFGGRGGGGGFGPGRQGQGRGPRDRQGNSAFIGNRSRGNQGMRGAVFLSFRNSALDASPYSLNGQATQKASYSQERFGFMIGGPLVIPKFLNAPQTFLFINYTGNRANNPYRSVQTVPTAAERAGDFSSLSSVLYDPLTRLPFAGNQIPLTRLDPAALGLIKFLPLPNQPGSIQNYVFVDSVQQDTDNLNIRLNHNLTKKDRMALNINYQRRNGNNLQPFGYLDETSGMGWNSDLNWTRNFGGRTLNTVRFNFNRNTSNTIPFFSNGPDIAAQLGILGSSRDPINFGPPNLSFTNYGSLSDASPVLVHNQSAAISDAFTWNRASHNISLGGEFRRNQLNTQTDQNARGTFSFSGLATSQLNATGQPVANTGYDFADFLLGLPQSSSIRFGSSSTYFRGNVYSLFGQDDWRVRPNLSLNLGLRYEYYTPLTEKYGHIANLDLAPGFTGAAVVTPGQAGPYGGTFPASLVKPDKNNLAPRVSLAWKPTAKSHTTVRLGYGIYYNGSVYNQIANRLAAQPPFASTSSISTSLSAPLTLETGLGLIPVGKTVLNTYAIDPGYRVGYAQTWSSSVQQELPRGIVLEIGYLGTKGTRLDIQRLPNRAAPGSPLTAEQRRQIGNAVGFTYESSEGDSIYHAMQVRLMRRFRRGISASALYTFGKSIDNSSTFGGAGNTVAQNDKDLRAERGLSSFDQRHTLSSNWVITSPVGGPGSKSADNTLVTRLLKDWTLSGGLSFSSGTPLTARVLGNLSDSSGTGAVGAGRADATGIPLSGGGDFFNPLAFTIPPSDRFGNAGRNTIPGPAIFSLNAGFGRSFSFGERRRLEFRLDSTNVLNHPNITSIGTVVNSLTYGFPLNAGAMRTVQSTLRFRF